MIRSLILGVPLIFSLHAYAQDALIFGAGNVSCGKFIETNDSKNRPEGDVLFSWIQGFLTAENYEWMAVVGKNNEKADLFYRTDFSAVKEAVINYCRKNPLENLSDASWAITRELTDRSASRKLPGK